MLSCGFMNVAFLNWMSKSDRVAVKDLIRVWNTNWGLLAVAERWTPLPIWVGVLVGLAGLLVIVLGGRRATRQHRGG